jgi:hypothetical protein
VRDDFFETSGPLVRIKSDDGSEFTPQAVRERLERTRAQTLSYPLSEGHARNRSRAPGNQRRRDRVVLEALTF